MRRFAYRHLVRTTRTLRRVAKITGKAGAWLVRNEAPARIRDLLPVMRTTRAPVVFERTRIPWSPVLSEDTPPPPRVLLGTEDGDRLMDRFGLKPCPRACHGFGRCPDCGDVGYVPIGLPRLYSDGEREAYHAVTGGDLPKYRLGAPS